jgi:hypothetical protein
MTSLENLEAPFSGSQTGRVNIEAEEESETTKSHHSDTKQKPIGSYFVLNSVT